MVLNMPLTTQAPSRNGAGTIVSQSELSCVFDTKEEYITHLIKTKEIRKDTRKFNDDAIHLIGTLKIDSRVKKGLNWNDVVATSAIVDKGMVSKYQYLPRTYKGVKTTLGIPSAELYIAHNSADALKVENKYEVNLFRISEQASTLNFSSVSANLTLFYGQRVALSNLPQSKKILGLAPKNLEVDCPDAYHVAKTKGCGEEILKILQPHHFLVTEFLGFIGRR